MEASLIDALQKENILRFDSAAENLTPRLCDLLKNISEKDKSDIREIRMRTDKPVTVIKSNGVNFISRTGRLTTVFANDPVSTNEDDINEIFHRLCGYSVHSCTQMINNGYVTVSGGHRAGVGGTAVCEGGRVVAVRDINCIDLRISRQIKGAANEIFNSCFSEGLCSVVIIGAPSSGKTTILRDLARQLSGEERGLFFKTVVCDERGELGSAFFSRLQNDLGVNCDVLTAYPKSEGIMIALRSFSPDIIICDEIATNEEVNAVLSGVNCGVNFALSVHAGSKEEIKRKPVLKKLAESGAFDKFVLLSSKNTGKTECVLTAGELYA